jgi:hypothetical protein
MSRYLLAFFIGWVCSAAVDVQMVAHSSVSAYRWLQQGWLAPFYGASAPRR